MSEVSKRNGFSDRNNMSAIVHDIQFKSLDTRTRISIYNAIVKLYKEYINEEDSQEFFEFIIGEIYCESLQVDGYYFQEDIFHKIHNTMLKDDYDKVLTVFEAVVQYIDLEIFDKNVVIYDSKYQAHYTPESIYNKMNTFLEKEYIGYRFIDNILVPISDEIELDEVSRAVSNAYEQVNSHIHKASRLLFNKGKPDFENSIKESISAVEAMCSIITDSKGKGAMLNNVLKGLDIHPAMREAFIKLYAFTSDASGIRHANKDNGRKATYEEARFMVVSCSAFVNYLKANYIKLSERGQIRKNSDL